MSGTIKHFAYLLAVKPRTSTSIDMKGLEVERKKKRNIFVARILEISNAYFDYLTFG